MNSEEEKLLLKRIIDSDVNLKLYKEKKCIFNLLDKSQKKFWDKIFGREIVTLESLELLLRSDPSVKLVFNIRKDITIDSFILEFIEEEFTWFKIEEEKPNFYLSLSSTLTILLSLDLLNTEIILKKERGRLKA